MTSDSDVVIAGAGLAGLACALHLAEAGLKVHVLEQAPVTGGRTSSWVQDGMLVESGLHRFLGFYRLLPALLRRAGIDLDSIVVWEDEVEIRPPGLAPAVFGIAPLHKPWRTASGLIGNNRLVSPLEKLALLRFLAAGIRRARRDPTGLDALTIVDYARERRLPDRVLHHVVQPFSTGVFFLPPERYSALAFFALFEPYLARLPAMRVGAFRGGMTEVLAEPLAQAVRARGGRVETGVAVTGLELDGAAVAGVRTDRGSLPARHVVVATGLGPAQRLLAEAFPSAEWTGPMLRLGLMPAATIQMELDQPALPVDRTTFAPGTALASFAEQSRTTFPRPTGRLSVILTPPEHFLALSPEQTLAETCREAERAGMDALRAHVTAFRVVNRREDFYSFEPGQDTLRPSQQTPVAGLTLAGDYTRQPYLATMEGAVASGLRAAAIVEAAAPSTSARRK